MKTDFTVDLIWWGSLRLAPISFIRIFEWLLVYCNCFTLIPVVVFIIILTFIKVVRNKCLNGASITAVRVAFASKKVECKKNSLSTRHSVRLCGKPGVHDKRHDTIYSDYSQVLNTRQDSLMSNSTCQ